jgi:two-component system, chemotaxis family, CheB/CheR fusion protein
LSLGDGRDITLGDLVQGELNAIGVTPGTEGIVVDGPPVKLPQDAVQLLALALHELATNALKHGALKESRGRLDVKWQMLDGMNTPRLELTWVESGIELNEREANSSRRGYGRELLELALPYQLDATTKLELAPSGLRFRLVLPYDEQGES